MALENSGVREGPHIGANARQNHTLLPLNWHFFVARPTSGWQLSPWEGKQQQHRLGYH
jgi:hypothetical protein